MRDDRHDDLVSTTAIVAGTVAGIAATVLSLLLSSDEAARPEEPVEVERIIASVAGPTPVVSEPRASAALPWTDPRGPERGPDEVEWEAITAYKTIESMAHAVPSDEAVDRALDELWSLAKENPENPFIQALQLKGLRVAQYWAVERRAGMRAALLQSRFENQAERSLKHDLTVLESMRMLVQRVEQGCIATVESGRELRRLAELFPSEQAEVVLRSGFEAVAACDGEPEGR